jgi:hypothetical protein
VKDEDDRRRNGRREGRRGWIKNGHNSSQPAKRERSALTLIKQTKNKLKIKEKNLSAFADGDFNGFFIMLFCSLSGHK